MKKKEDEAKDSLSSGLDVEDSSNELFISASFNSLFSDQDVAGETDQSLQDLLTGAVTIPLSQRIMLKISEDFAFNCFMMALTLLNGLLVCLELYSPLLIGWTFGIRVVDSMLLGVFTFEVWMRMWGWRLTFFRHWWMMFDLSIALIGWFLPLGRTLIPQMTYTAYSILSVVRVARLCRVFRTLKSLKAVESIQTILQTLYLSLPALLTIYLLTLLIGYFYAVMSVVLFGHVDPQNFGNLASSAKVYLQVSSLDLWTQIYFKSKDDAPALFPVLVSYIIVQTFVLLNLLTAVIVDNLAMLRKRLSKTKTKRTTKRKKSFISAGVRLGDRKKVDTNIGEFGLGEYYSKDIPVRSQMCMTTYFQNLAALEHSLHQLARQRKMIDEMVDLLKRHFEEKKQK